MFRRRPVRQAGELFVGCPIVHSGRMRPGHAPFVDRLVSAQVRRWMRQLHLADVDLITFSPRFGALDSIPRRTLTVWMKDRDWAGEDVLHGDWLRARHELLVRSADVVTGVSDELVNDCRALGVEAALIHNGCDTEHSGKAAIRANVDPRISVDPGSCSRGLGTGVWTVTCWPPQLTVCLASRLSCSGSRECLSLRCPTCTTFRPFRTQSFPATSRRATSASCPTDQAPSTPPVVR